MNSTATALTFQSKTFDVVDHAGQPWLTMADIVVALYRKGGGQTDAPLVQGSVELTPPPHALRQMQRLYQRHADEFTANMTALVERATAGGKQMVRIFSLRGAHLLAMFARTPVAKEFRAWVLDILDREVAQPTVESKNIVDDKLLASAFGLCVHVEFMYSWFRRIYPGLRLISPGLAARAHDHFGDGIIFCRGLVHRLGLQSYEKYAATFPWDGDSTERAEYRRRNLHLLGGCAA